MKNWQIYKIIVIIIDKVRKICYIILTKGNILSHNIQKEVKIMEKKIRHSKQRDMIYEYLLSTKEHPSADMVYENLRPKMPNLSLGTVYRNLKLLEEMGSIRRVTTLQNSERYDANISDHAHFECDTCGCVKDLEILDLNKAKESCGVSKKDNIKWMNLIFGGTCECCMNKTI